MSAHQTGAGAAFGSARPISIPIPGAAAPVEAFTSEMRDRQARGKDPYESSEGSGGDYPSEGGKKYRKGGYVYRLHHTVYSSSPYCLVPVAYYTSYRTSFRPRMPCHTLTCARIPALHINHSLTQTPLPAPAKRLSPR